MNLPPDPRYLPPGRLHWSRDLFLASLFLTTGTTVLALGAIAFLASMNLLIFLLGGAIVEIFHLLAWLYLRVASHADAAASRAFRVSILLFLPAIYLIAVSFAYALVLAGAWHEYQIHMSIRTWTRAQP